MSLAALVTSWRMYLYDEDGNALPELQGRSYHDPKWCYWINVASLVNGFVGNIFLLFNFTNRIRYIVALPMTILNWYIATGMLIAITVSINQYVPPQENEAYTQGFWYAIEAAVLYLICSMLLMVNMLGYFLGHYPQHFTLTDHQRTLILQTMLFFIWLAGGAAVFSRVESLHGTTDDAYKIRSFADGVRSPPQSRTPSVWLSSDSSTSATSPSSQSVSAISTRTMTSAAASFSPTPSAAS